MKKAMKKLMAALLAVAMLCALAVPALAANDGSITIKGAVEGQTYKIYRILNLETNDSYTAYKYTVNTDWQEFVNAHTDVFKIENGVVSLADSSITNNSTEIQELANAAGDYAKTKNISTDATATSTSNTVSGLALGYYLVVADPGLANPSLCSLGTTTPSVEIQEKNGKPTIDKKVEHAAGSTGSANDATVGDTVNYVVTINVTDGDPQDYVMHDKMSTGLQFNQSSVVVKRGSDTLTNGTDYTLDTNPLDGHTFDIKFINGKLHTNDVITITYNATLTKDAVVGTTGNDNDVKLDYKNGTAESHTRTYTWSFDIFKYFKNGEDETRLAGAEFQLYRYNGEDTEYAVMENGKITGWDTDVTKATTLTTDNISNITIAGLANGTYYLKETKAPEGYNKLAADVEIDITAENWSMSGTPSVTIKYDNETANNGIVKVENKTGTTLPGTGGIGTTIFYVVGGGLMLAAAVLLITKKRMEGKN